MPQGKIKKLVLDRGFGFIATERGDVFFHHSSVADQRFDDLKEGQLVEYDIDSDNQRGGGKGDRAANVRPV